MPSPLNLIQWLVDAVRRCIYDVEWLSIILNGRAYALVAGADADFHIQEGPAL
jgi:hypothetical protein